ncbi:hypothetical protein SXIM_23830 [Streptomyces xiamenensis]|uniref:Uncharacterized protein n=1 Tax=Streptomyces xiamenensis TaxID=408015 RepID=A0A0F7FUE3_9ACTN|nr:hypothetical protein [Streptomyces xiamenensis]AKG43767.1 hypothetical protein SXIM_23830 [Streptomyces xiamenensis]
MKKPLDPMTIERVAHLIVDMDGPYERRGWQLTQLLQHAGWQDAPEYDGLPRLEWMKTVMEKATDDIEAIERLLCRICDPIEYREGAPAAEAVQDELNRILVLEGLAVRQVSGRPVLGELTDDGQSAVFTAPDDLEARLRPLVSGEDALRQLLERVEEARICERNGAYVLALVGIGSFTEGLLLNVLIHRDPDLLKGFPVGKGAKRKDLDYVSLEMLLDTAHDRGWIRKDRHEFMTIVRQYRNFVHIRAQQRRGVVPDQHTVGMCWGPVRVVLEDLEASQ